MRDSADRGEGNRSRDVISKDEERIREQWRECLRSGCGGRGGGYDRDRVVKADGGLTGDC